MKWATQLAIKEHAQGISSDFSSQAGVLTPTRTSVVMLKAENGRQEAKGSINDLAVRSQPAFIGTGPSSGVGGVRGRDTDHVRAIALPPVLAPALGVEATVSPRGPGTVSPNRLKSPNVADRQGRTFSTTGVG
jgi:hypothetical protein